jgi:hypothetical protein
MKQLTQLANKYSSDKGTTQGSKHGFSEIYDDYFTSIKNENINILEIGVNDGSSLKMWYEYFPKAFIYGLDIDDKLCYNNDRVSCGILDQSKDDHLDYFIKNINTKFDIILDDGSHHLRDQQLTFYYFLSLLNSGGIYVIEDLHTSLCDNNTNVYGRNIEIWDDKSNTTLFYLQNKPYNSVYLNNKQNHYIQNNIKEVHIFEKDNMNVPNDYKNKSITSVIIKK